MISSLNKLNTKCETSCEFFKFLEFLAFSKILKNFSSPLIIKINDLHTREIIDERCKVILRITSRHAQEDYDGFIISLKCRERALICVMRLEDVEVVTTLGTSYCFYRLIWGFLIYHLINECRHRWRCERRRKKSFFKSEDGIDRRTLNPVNQLCVKKLTVKEKL